MFIFFSLQSCLGIVIITLHMHFFSLERNSRPIFPPKSFTPNSIFTHLSQLKGNKSFIALLPFRHWNFKVYQQERYLQIQREPAVYWLPLLYVQAELSALWSSVWNCRIRDNTLRHGPPPGTFTANTFKQAQSRLKHPCVAWLRTSLQKYEIISPPLTNNFHGLKIPSVCFKNKEGNLTCVAMRHHRWASSTQLSRWVSLNMFTFPRRWRSRRHASATKAAEVINRRCVFLPVWNGKYLWGMKVIFLWCWGNFQDLRENS